MLDRLFPSEFNRARYLPAISHQYSVWAADPLFRCGQFTDADLDYLSRSSVFRYPAGLSSAGQAIYRSGKVKPHNTMVAQRNRANTFLITDSGGFQIQQGTIRWYPQGHKQDTLAKVLGWQEAHADYVMALDFPTGGISNGNILPHQRELESSGFPLRSLSDASGLSRGYHTCLEHTIRNTDRMLNLRAQAPSGSGFLCVLQGRNEQESRHWYKATRHQIAQADGIAFAGTGNRDFLIIMNRLIDLKQDNLLAGIRHIHVLGTSTLMAGALLTCVQRNLRAHTAARDVQITYDTATPFQEANRYYGAFSHYLLDKQAWVMPPGRPLGDATVDEHEFTLNDWCAYQERALFHALHPREGLCRALSSIGDQAKVGDIFYAPQKRFGPVRKFKPTWRGALLLTLHNVEVMIRAHSAAISAYLDNNCDVMVPEVRDIAALVDHAFDPAPNAARKAAMSGRSSSFVKIYVSSFDVHSYLSKRAGVLQALV